MSELNPVIKKEGDILRGYAPVHATHWIMVSGRPAEINHNGKATVYIETSRYIWSTVAEAEALHKALGQAISIAKEFCAELGASENEVTP